MNHFCSTLDSVETNCSAAETAINLDHLSDGVKFEFAIHSDERKGHFLESFFRSSFRRWLSGIETGAIAVIEGSESWSTGSNTSEGDSLHAHIAIADPAAYRRMITGSTLGAAESYADDQWSSDDLTSLIRIMIRNLGVVHKVDRSWSRAKNFWNWLRHSLRRNTLAGSRRNIHEHYDLGNDFYKLFLDPTLSYSSAIFGNQAGSLDYDSTEPNSLEDLHAASIHKLNVVRQKLNVCSSDHVLEIGTGWGAMAVHLASTTGCRVTTTTISQEQYGHAVRKVQEAGLEDQITVLQQDYRQLAGSYDKIVSIEMIEAVGHQYFDQFFSTCSNLLKPGGKMLLQSILIAGQHYQAYIRRTDFIRRHIFPGGCLPSIGAIQQSVDRVTDFQMTRMDDYSHDYALTLKIWRRAFMSQLSEVRRLGYDQKFIRLWHFYLCYCEAAFRERRTNLAQIVFEKPSSVTVRN
jgi:cyclopropane-fatty-acyl-phospholipid synthase